MDYYISKKVLKQKRWSRYIFERGGEDIDCRYDAFEENPKDHFSGLNFIIHLFS